MFYIIISFSLRPTCIIYTQRLAWFSLSLHHQECFNCPYGCEYFKEYAEPVPAEAGQPGPEAGESCRALSQVARECGVFLVGGMCIQLQIIVQSNIFDMEEDVNIFCLCRLHTREVWR